MPITLNTDQNFRCQSRSKTTQALIILSKDKRGPMIMPTKVVNNPYFMSSVQTVNQDLNFLRPPNKIIKTSTKS
jgi:hypothetical protein